MSTKINERPEPNFKFSMTYILLDFEIHVRVKKSRGDNRELMSEGRVGFVQHLWRFKN